jgi:hypothetical protein
MYNIQRNVPIPSRQGRPLKYPVDKLTVGDSFFVPMSEGNPSTVTASATKKAKVLGIRLSIRRLEENGEAGVRVWRVE